MTSVNQCTPRSTRLVATAAAIPAAPAASATFARLGFPMPHNSAIAANVAAAVVACPDGNDDPEKPVSWRMSGRLRSTITLARLEMTTWPPTTTTRNHTTTARRVRRYMTAAVTSAAAIITGVPPRRLTSRRKLVDPLVA